MFLRRNTRWRRDGVGRYFQDSSSHLDCLSPVHAYRPFTDYLRATRSNLQHSGNNESPGCGLGNPRDGCRKYKRMGGIPRSRLAESLIPLLPGPTLIGTDPCVADLLEMPNLR